MRIIFKRVLDFGCLSLPNTTDFLVFPFAEECRGFGYYMVMGWLEYYDIDCWFLNLIPLVIYFGSPWQPTLFLNLLYIFRFVLSFFLFHTSLFPMVPLWSAGNTLFTFAIRSSQYITCVSSTKFDSTTNFCKNFSFLATSFSALSRLADIFSSRPPGSCLLIPLWVRLA